MKSDKNKAKKRFSYRIVNSQGKVIKGYIDTFSSEEATNYLKSMDYEVLSVREVSKFLTMNIGRKELQYSALTFILTQLSTYLKAGIPLVDAVKILEKQSSNREQRRIFSNVVYELSKGEKFSYALESQNGVFPKFLVNMVKTAEATGDLPSTLDSLIVYYDSLDKTKKEAVTAMTYPIIISIFAIMVITFIMLYIVPSFESLFKTNNANIPSLTTFVIGVSRFLSNNLLLIILAILFILLVYMSVYRKSSSFRKAVQTFYMHLPIVGKAIIYKEVSMFTKTFANLLSHNVFITDSMDILKNLTNNEVYKVIINDSIKSLACGEQISDSFRGKWAFPVVAYEMLVTGEKTGDLPLMMDHVSKYYEDLYSNFLKRINKFIEPIMILILSLIVGVVVLSIVIPMFSFYSTI